MSAVPAPESGPDAGAVWHYGDPLGEQRAAATEAVVVDRGHRATIELTGDDRQTWLHTISSQHVSALPEGSVVQNLSLDLQGRVEDHWLQTELGGVTTLDTEPWRGEPLADFLRKMVFWSKVEVAPADLAVLSLLGPAVNQLDLPTPDAEWTATPLPGGGFVRRVGAQEVDLVVPRADAATWRQRLLDAGVRPAGLWAYEALRVAALRPRLGVDTDERTIPHEVGWIGGPGVGAVHLDKGCYRGQETIARVHNLGKPPRMLALLHLDGGDDRPTTGDPVLAGERAIGRVGTVAEHVDLGPIALALLKRGVPADTELTTGGDAQVPAAIDPDSLPDADTSAGAGRAAVDRLRGGAR
ncbi:folate-binding protein YgfZ [Mycobacterium sp. CBMA 234]|uniref:CAF17-like 4Fe-4S cluster assembly/insertion protein YgfZ n=1 Tax=Mycolicibacterium sp. CBMA 234 TaxID=1918495 RepID=UPI0012DE61DE|nr:folate-binding protein YgfZ [Mycolicibacterium sp. CBMA 234]MUL64313.1 folate-binding protein YgfZ [Mycolicibacterium sp. CBMA 234]